VAGALGHGFLTRQRACQFNEAAETRRNLGGAASFARGG